MKKIIIILIVAILLVKPVQASTTNFDLVENIVPTWANSFNILPASQVFPEHLYGNFKADDDSGISGDVNLSEVSENLDTDIEVKVRGLKPNVQYVAIYHQNYDCSKELGIFDHVIQGAFNPDANTEGNLQDRVKDDIKRIHSVSIRTSSDFKLIACAKV